MKKNKMNTPVFCPICYRSWDETNCSNFKTPHSYYDVVEFLIKDRETVRREADAWRNTATALSIKLKTAVATLEYYAAEPDEDEYNQGLARDTLAAIIGE